MDSIRVERHGRAGLITFQRPSVMNAWHRAMRREIVAALTELDADHAIRAVVLTGAGQRAFGAGQDLNEAPPATPEEIDAWVDEWRVFYGAVRGLSKPVIAAMNGVAAGSAFQFALMADFRIGHDGVRMGQPEIKAGIASTMGPWIIHAVLGPILAADLSLTGRIMSAEECRRHGLLTRVVPADDVISEALRLAEELADKPPFAVALTRQRLARLSEADFQDSLALWTQYLRQTNAAASDADASA